MSMKTHQDRSFQSLIKTEKKRGACALAGPFYSIVEHTAPIAAMLGIPMLTKEPSILFNFKRFYPDLKCEFRDWTLPYLIKNYSTVFYGFNVSEYTFRELIGHFKEEDPQNPIWDLPIKFIYHLHGCSDKHWFKSNAHSHLFDVDQVLLYGKRMVDLFKGLDLEKRLVSYGLVGNYRLSYYKKHQEFFDSLVEKEIFSKFKKKQTTLLYAPTWMDAKKGSSIFKAYQHVIEKLPDSMNLLIKLHPNLSLHYDSHDPRPLYEALDQYASRPNVQIVPLFPCIYPILNKVDAYLGDYSSVGYDALSFSLPMFFINHHKLDYLRDPTAYLLRCGTSIATDDLEKIYSIIDKELPKDCEKFSKIRKETYHYAFGVDPTYSEMQQRLKKFLL